jgi:hypothetical protein
LPDRGTPVSLARHKTLTWQRPADFFFAKQDAICALVGKEIPRAMLAIGIAFMAHGGVHVPVAIQGCKQGQNLLVGADGRWLVDYVPAIYRAYPFRLARNAEGNDFMCIDEVAGGVSDSPTGEPFFDADGTPSKLVADALALLGFIEREHVTTRNACALLAKHEVLEPWPLHYQDGANVTPINGLLRVSEARLNALDAAALHELREAGALLLAYCQLLSIPQVHQLAKLQASKPQPGQAPALNLSDNNGVISFDNL